MTFCTLIFTTIFSQDLYAQYAQPAQFQLSLQDQLSVGQKAPDFKMTDLDGKTLSLSDYKGKWVLLDFWATWCRPCIMEMDNVINVHKKYHDKGFEIIGISLDRNLEMLQKYIKLKSIPWRQCFDGNGWRNQIAVKYKVNSIPSTYLVNPNGIIIDKMLRGQNLENAIKAALNSENIDKR